MREHADRHASARFVSLEGVGHELPTGVWSEIIDEVAAHTAEPTDRRMAEPRGDMWRDWRTSRR